MGMAGSGRKIALRGSLMKTKIVITTDGLETRATLYEKNKVIKTATTKCGPNDKFSFDTEARIAFKRLFDSAETEEPKYFNGKVVCVAETMGFTVGKIYEFIDGQCVDDQKTLRPVGLKCRTLAFFGHVFVPLVE